LGINMVRNAAGVASGQPLEQALGPFLQFPDVVAVGASVLLVVGSMPLPARVLSVPLELAVDRHMHQASLALEDIAAAGHNSEIELRVEQCFAVAAPVHNPEKYNGRREQNLQGIVALSWDPENMLAAEALVK